MRWVDRPPACCARFVGLPLNSMIGIMETRARPTRQCINTEDRMEEVSLRIAGMSCGGCVNSVRTALARLPGVEVREVEVGRATLAYDPRLSTPESIQSAIVKAGFEALTV
ncbi:MAG TPA: heavy-metal-associated domain-containing protein [Gemmatimonadales bacterium]